MRFLEDFVRIVADPHISPPGEHAKLFWSEPQTGFTSGLPAKAPKPEPVDHWQRAIQAIDEAIIEARHNPETARSLFALASCDLLPSLPLHTPYTWSSGWGK